MNRKTKLRIYAIFTLIFLSFGGFHFTYAYTNVFGTISVDTEWTTLNSPYLISNLQVDSGVTLTIDPGVVVKFKDEYSYIDINGNLNINGTKENKVYFTSISDDSVGGDSNADGNDTQPTPRSWRNIKFNSGSSSSISYLDLKYAGALPFVGIYNNGGNVSIDNSTISQNGDQGFFQASGSSIISSSLISDQIYGIHSIGGDISISGSSINNNTALGITNDSSTIIDAKNNFWGDPSGPFNQNTNPTGLGNGVSNKVDIAPWLTEDPFEMAPPPNTCTVDCFSNVLFLPGIEASRLYKLRSNGTEDQLWEPNPAIHSDVSELYLDSIGKSINSNIYTKDVIDTTNSLGPLFSGNIYKSFINNLNDLVSSNKINNWKAFAYDWRQGVEDLVENGTKYDNNQVLTLIDTFQSLVNSSKNGKVTIVAHSNGGLLAKAFINKLEDMKATGQNNLIDDLQNLIMVASPQLGTPGAMSAILHGYQQSHPIVLSQIQARKLAQNMPAAYGLLSSKKYFDQVGIVNPGVFNSSANQIYKTTYGEEINNYQEEHNFIIGQEGRMQPLDSDLISPIIGNNELLYQAENLHDSIDNMTFPASLNIIDIAGWGKSTIAGITYTASDIQPIFTIRGDQTVVIPSALYGPGTKYWLDLSNSKLKHANILEDSQLLDFIDDIIEQKSISTSGVKSAEPIQAGNRLHLSVHSPVSFAVYDSENNFTGKVCDNGTGNCYIQEDIPGSSYFEFGEGKYINLGQGKIQKAVIQGTGIGTFTFNSDLVSPNGETTRLSFVDIPVTTQTQGEVTFNSGELQLKLDVTGDGVTDLTLGPSSIFDPITYLRVMKATIDSLDISKDKIKTFDKRVDDMIKLIQLNKVNKAKLNVDKFKATLDKVISTSDPKHPKPQKISKNDAQLLLDMLNKLLDNLS